MPFNNTNSQNENNIITSDNNSEDFSTKNSIEGDSTLSNVKVLSIGKQRFSWQRALLLFLTSISIIVLFMIFVFILKNGLQIIPNLIEQHLVEHPERSKFVAFIVSIFNFLFRNEWRPTTGEFGIIHAILGTFLVVIIAMLISIPISVACAIFMAEIAPPVVRKILKPSVELLASIPSIVYGFFGLFTFVPLIKSFFNLPIMIKILGSDLPTGETALSGGVLLAIMVIPTIVSITDDSLKAVPNTYREGSFALGATRWQTIRKIIVPASTSGIFAAIILAFGRAIGETMAVLMVTGGSPHIPSPFFDILEPIDTLTALIARQLGVAAVGSFHYNAIFAAAIVLFAITFFVNLIGNIITKRYAKRLAGA